MKLAKEVLGLRESWNPHSNWGLQALSHHLLGIHVDKGSQCSNWEADELSEQQVEYAAIDVFLPWMLGMMLKTLKTKFKAKRGALAVRWNGAQAIPEMCHHPLPIPHSTLLPKALCAWLVSAQPHFSLRRMRRTRRMRRMKRRTRPLRRSRCSANSLVAASFGTCLLLHLRAFSWSAAQQAPTKRSSC